MTRIYYQPARDRIRILYPNGTVEYNTDFFYCKKTNSYKMKWKRSCYSYAKGNSLTIMKRYDKLCGWEPAIFICKFNN